MKRRGNSEGCITKDSRGKWIARLQIGYNSNGNPRIKTFSGNTPTEARRRMNNFKKNLTNMDGLTKADGLMSEGLRYWSDKYKKPTLKPSSYDRLMQTIEYQIIIHRELHDSKGINRRYSRINHQSHAKARLIA